MSGPWIILTGIALWALAFLIALNTSAGGTRSDYDDGSGFIVGIGSIAAVVGFVVTLWEIYERAST